VTSQRNFEAADGNEYEVVVVGGGPAGMTAALYATRLGHRTAIVNRGGGRAAMMQDTHNVLGVSESVSGGEYLHNAREQLLDYGTDLFRGAVTEVECLPGGEDPAFVVGDGDAAVVADRLVLATGFSDERPDPPLPRTGRGLHYCLHCDAYMFVDEPVYVMGHGEAAAHVAMIMLNFTPEVDLLTRGADPEWSDETARQLDAHPIDVVEEEVTGIENGSDGWLEALEFADGARREYRGGFAMYGADYNNGLALDLGAEVDEDGAVVVDDHGRTSVEGLFAVGDLTPGHKQIPVALGEGAKAGIAVHYGLRTYPVSIADLEDGVPEPPAVDEYLRERAGERRERPVGSAADD
jgi:thioredoxin reductase (NADPH)